MPEEPKRRATPLEAFKAVFWSFLGVRKRKQHESDAVNLTPVQVIIAGLIGAALFVLVLVLVVRMVISNAAG